MIHVIFPETTETLLADRLRRLTELLGQRGEDIDGGLLGGRYGYGANFSSDVFTMRKFWWGDDCTCTHETEEERWYLDHPHAPDCYQTALHEIDLARVPTRADYEALCAKHGIPWNDGLGCAGHCTCGVSAQADEWHKTHQHAPDCAPYLPNFKCGEYEVRWYKYIGRSMEVSAELSEAELGALFDRCEESLR